MWWWWCAMLLGSPMGGLVDGWVNWALQRIIPLQPMLAPHRPNEPDMVHTLHVAYRPALCSHAIATWLMLLLRHWSAARLLKGEIANSGTTQPVNILFWRRTFFMLVSKELREREREREQAVRLGKEKKTRSFRRNWSCIALIEVAWCHTGSYSLTVCCCCWIPFRLVIRARNCSTEPILRHNWVKSIVCVWVLPPGRKATTSCLLLTMATTWFGRIRSPDDWLGHFRRICMFAKNPLGCCGARAACCPVLCNEIDSDIVPLKTMWQATSCDPLIWSWFADTTRKYATCQVCGNANGEICVPSVHLTRVGSVHVR